MLKCFGEWKSLMSKPKFALILFLILMYVHLLAEAPRRDLKTVNKYFDGSYLGYGFSCLS